MSLIIATGANLGDRKNNLDEAKKELQKFYKLIQESRIYRSQAVGYEDQPEFYNQVLEFEIPHNKSPEDVMTHLLEIEKGFGRTRDIHQGPRTIDIDMIFWGLTEINTPLLTLPHPRWAERSFVILPLQELPFFKTIEKCFIIPKSFTIEAFPI